jgi:hypothetical protein
MTLKLKKNNLLKKDPLKNEPFPLNSKSIT